MKERPAFSFGPAMVLMAGRMVGFAATFFVPIVLARVFTPEAFGTYKQLFLVYATRQTVPEPSSVTINDPSWATATPTGRPQTLPSLVTKPTRKCERMPYSHLANSVPQPHLPSRICGA